MNFLDAISKLSDRLKQKLNSHLKGIITDETFKLLDTLLAGTKDLLTKQEQAHLRQALEQAFKNNNQLRDFLNNEKENQQTIGQIIFGDNIAIAMGYGVVISGSVQGDVNINHHHLPKPIPRILTSIPFIDDLTQVVGRGTELKKVTNLLEGSSKPLLVNGANRVGKTTLAKAFLTENNQQFQHIAWMNVAGGDLKKAFAENQQLIDSLDLSKDIQQLKKGEAYNDKAFEIIINRMRILERKEEEGNRYNLLIIDDADTDLQGAEMLTHITLAPHWKVLVTSREDLAGLKKYHLKLLPKEDTKKLFYLHYKYKLSEQQVELAKQQTGVDTLIERIIKLDDYHTLNIEQISKGANTQGMLLKEVFDTLQEKGVGVFADKNSKSSVTHNLRDERGFNFFRTNYLRKRLREANKGLRDVGICCIRGMAGIGKTFFAHEIANNKKRDDRYDIIWWIDADKGKIDPSLKEFAFKEGIDTTKGRQVWMDSLKKHLKHKRWLLIYDNACDTQSKGEITTFYKENIIAPDATKKQQVLITSRNSYWTSIEKDIMEVKLKYWTNEEINEFLGQKKIDVPDETQLDILSNLPLAAALARSFLIDQEEGKRDFTTFYERWEATYNSVGTDYMLDDLDNLSDFYKDSHNDPQKKYKSLFAIIELSFKNLKKPLQNLLKDICCFAPDEIPMKVLYGRNETAEPFGSANYPDLKDKLTKLEKFSFVASQQEGKEQYSIHRLTQQSIRIIAKPKGQLDTKVKNGVTLLKNAFKAKDPENWALIPHVDAIFDQARVLSLNEVRKDATDLFYEAGMFHYDMGETIRAEDFLEMTSKLMENDAALEANVHMRLAKLLFLKGKDGFEQAEKFANKAVKYFEQVGDVENEVKCKNEVLVKIRQRKCEFDKAQELFEDIKEIYTDNEKFKDKLSGMYHNIASLHWTWGRKNTPKGEGKNDYETSVHYFKKALEASDEAIEEHEEKRILAKGAKEKREQEGIISNKLLYQAVSRMIFGAVYGLLKQFDKQAEQHKQALTHFKNQAKEKRRLAYTAYYMLAYGWDRETLNAEDASIGKCDYFEEPGFKEIELIKLIGEQKMYLATNEKEEEGEKTEEQKKKEEQKDEKYTLIAKIVTLRLAIRQEKMPEKYENIPSIFVPENLNAAFIKLKGQLEEMKYILKEDGVEKERYYDVDTCSVSAVLDYGAYLYSIDDLKKAKKVMTLAKAMTHNIMYHRELELNSLCEKLGIA